jgi:hypothetical protein
MSTQEAGRSAQARADKQRSKALRLLASADRFERGAQGEAEVAALLAALPPIYTVLHDLQVPGSKANIDHLVIGPAGVFVVDAKRYSQPLRYADGMLWRGRYPLRKQVETVAWEAQQASAALQVPVTPMLCFVGAVLPMPVVDLPPVRATTGDALVPSILQGAAGLTITDISRITLLAQRLLPPAGTPSARPAAKPNPTPKRRTSPAPVSTRPTKQRPVKRSRKRPRLAPLLLGCAFLGWLMLGGDSVNRVFSALGDGLADVVTSGLPDSPTTPSTVAGPAPGVPSVHGDFSCPAPGAGWVLTMQWPGDGASGGYQLASSADQTAWTTFATWTSAAQAAPHLANIGPGTAVNVRVQSTGVPSTSADGTFRSPGQPC